MPSGAAQSFTLTAPPEKAPATESGTTPGDEKTASGAADVGSVDPSAATKGSSGEVTPSNNEGNVRGGNLFVPGGSAAQGGRHRADAGPGCGQGLRNAAEKTIKGLTGLGRGGKSDSSGARASNSGGGSGSGSSDSGASGSSSGS